MFLLVNICLGSATISRILMKFSTILKLEDPTSFTFTYEIVWFCSCFV